MADKIRITNQLFPSLSKSIQPDPTDPFQICGNTTLLHDVEECRFSPTNVGVRRSGTFSMRGGHLCGMPISARVSAGCSTPSLARAAPIRIRNAPRPVAIADAAFDCRSPMWSTSVCADFRCRPGPRRRQTGSRPAYTDELARLSAILAFRYCSISASTNRVLTPILKGAGNAAS